MAKWSGNRDRNTPLRHRALQRAAMIGIRSAISIRARGQWPHPEAVYMTAPRSVCRNTKKALAERGPSIHDERSAESMPARGLFHRIELFGRGSALKL